MPGNERRLLIPNCVPEDFANAVAGILMLGLAGGSAWDQIYKYSPDESLSWIAGILKMNDSFGLVHADMQWWTSQIRGH